VSLSLFWLISSNAPAIDTVRLSLEGSSEEWFSWVRYAGYAVAVGCAMEAPETFIIIKRWWLLRFCEEDREETKEDKRSLIVPLAALGLLIIVAGVVVETYAEDRVSYFDGLLRTHESDKITAAEGEAAEATRQAGSAADSSKVAHQESDAAATASGNALDIASGARKEADSFEHDIVTAKQQSASATKQAADAESHLADALQRAAMAERELEYLRTPRSLKDVPSLVAMLAPLKGTQYAMNTFQDDEAFRLTQSIDAVLQAAGWIRKQPPYRLGVSAFNLFGENNADSVPVCADTGIQIHHVTRESIEELQSRPEKDLPKAIRSAIFLKNVLEPQVLPPDTRNVGKLIALEKKDSVLAEQEPIVICVGKKP
jgi:hypothetical protein